MLSPAALRLVPLFVLACSALLRLALVIQGGQYYFGDENRYDRGLKLYQALAAGDVASARLIVAQPEHPLFVWVGAGLSAAQRTLSHLTPFGDWSHPEHIVATMWIAAALLSLFSALNVLLVHRLARAAGAADEEALWALVLMAVANTAFYHSRHLLPYDCALTAALLGLVVGLGRHTVARAALCGLLGGVAYGLYNGYWFLPPVLWLTHTVACAHAPSAVRWRLGAACTGGLVVGLGLPLLLGTFLAGPAYWSALLAFSQTVKQGVFAEGWSLPWVYLWHSEGPAGAALALGFAALLWTSHRAHRPLPAHIRLTLLSLAAAYALLVLFSCGLARFVVYARTVKPLLPALCLLGGWTLHRLLAPRPALRLPAVGLLLLVGLVHLAPHFALTFPREFKVAVYATLGIPKHVNSLAGTLYLTSGSPITRPDLALANAQGLFPVSGRLDLPPGETLLRADHPLALAVYQYEGHTPRERALIRATDISMRVIKLARPDSVPDHPPLDQLYGAPSAPAPAH